MGFPKQEYWNGLLSPSPGGIPDPWMEKITRTAIVIISDVVNPESYEYSKLYDKKFSHGYRKAKVK